MSASLTPNYSTQDNRDFWRQVYLNALDVASWPAWKRGWHDVDPEEVTAIQRRLDALNELEAHCIWLTK